MSESDLAIVAALVFAWGTLSARLERFDVTAPIIFVLAGVLLTHGPLAVERQPGTGAGQGAGGGHPGAGAVLRRLPACGRRRGAACVPAASSLAGHQCPAASTSSPGLRE